MKLEPVKCPNCEETIEVNKELEKAICQYCGNTILIKEAVQNLKSESVEKVEVDGVKSDRKKFEEVEKYFKLKEYANAKKL